MIRAFFFALLLVLSTAAAATSFTSTSTKGFKGSGWNGSGSLSGGTAQTIESVNVGGTYVGVPMVGSIGAAALDVAIAGLRSAPQAIAVGVVMPYLVSKGLELINGGWFTKGQSVSPSGLDGCYRYIDGAIVCSEADFMSHVNALYGYLGPWTDVQTVGTPPNSQIQVCRQAQTTWCTSANYYAANANPCPSGYTYATDGSQLCWPTDPVPATDTDWNAVRGDPPPDAVMQDLCQRLSALGGSTYACPATNVKAAATQVALTDWSTDPVTGNQTRQIAKIDPAPTTDDPQRVSVSTSTETKTPDTTDPTTGQTTPGTTSDQKNQTEDFCTLHPDSIACSQLGDPPDDVDLQKKDVSAQITPDTGWGPSNGSCPPDKTYTLHNGFAFRMSYAPICETSTTLRPLIIGLGWFIAALIFVGYTWKVS